jgi:hypothetical protein
VTIGRDVGGTLLAFGTLEHLSISLYCPELGERSALSGISVMKLITEYLAAIMHDAARFYSRIERDKRQHPTGWVGVTALAVQRVWG